MSAAEQTLEKAFHALGNPTRRAVIARLGTGPVTVSELAEPFEMALPSFVQHLNVLERAGLLVSRKEGRVRTCRLNPAALGQVENWLVLHRQQWEDRLDRLESHVKKTR